MKKSFFKRFIDFLKEDSFPSLIVSLIIAFLLIKYVFFPVLSFLTGSSLPLVIVESCSMYHKERGFNLIFSKSDIYSKNGIDIKDTKKWDFQDGFSKGDIIFVVSAKNAKVGDVIIFDGSARNPIIHRVVSIREENGIKIYSTKGDNNEGQLKPPRDKTDETNIPESKVIGKALFRVPLLGWVKLIFFEPFRDPRYRGLCY